MNPESKTPRVALLLEKILERDGTVGPQNAPEEWVILARQLETELIAAKVEIKRLENLRDLGFADIKAIAERSESRFKELAAAQEQIKTLLSQNPANLSDKPDCASDLSDKEQIERLRGALEPLLAFDKNFPKGRVYSATNCPPEKELDRIIEGAKAALSAAPSGERFVSDSAILDWLESNLLAIHHDQATCSVDMSGNKVTGQVVLPNKSSAGTRRPRIRAKTIRALVLEAMAMDDPQTDRTKEAE